MSQYDAPAPVPPRPPAPARLLHKKLSAIGFQRSAGEKPLGGGRLTADR
jgi:hypothetical protein